MSEPYTTARVYGAGPRTRRILLAVWASCMAIPALLLLAGAVAGESGSIIAGLLVGAIISAVMLPIFWLSAWRYPRLVLRDTGVEVHQVGMRLETTWDNVAAISTRGKLALVLRAPMTSPGAGTQMAFGGTAIGGAPLYDDEARWLIAERRYMPIDVFAYWLQHGDLAAELVRRAPHLGPDVGSAVAALSAPGRPVLADAGGQPLTRRNMAAIVAVIALAMGLAVVVVVGPPEVRHRVEQVFQAVLAVAFASFAATNIAAAIRCFRQGQTWPGLLWGALAVALALLALGLFGSLVSG